MTEFTIDFNFRPEVLESATGAESQVDQILGEIKGELFGPDNEMSEAVRLSSELLCRSEN